MKILVLGKTGMLGSMVYDYFKKKGACIYGTQRKRKNAPFYLNLKPDDKSGINLFTNNRHQIDYIINCIGIIRVKGESKDAFLKAIYINGVFPHILAEYAKRYSIKVIHISTDGVFKSRKTPYRENSACNNTDVYALSKRLGEVISPAVLNIRSSIIGPEFNKPAKSLLGWFLSRKDGSVVEGFINHIWNGVTTLQVSEFCYGLIFDKLFDSLVKETNVVHFAPNKPISKYGLLDVIKKTYQRNIRINKKKAKEEMIRILDSYYKDLYARYISNDMEYEVGRLRDYTYNFLKGERR